ncbi:MAG: hypothetical protein CVU56_29265 [Deltaproteobacteria bacterium HGW-Deltaproteobacteria-14]|jgi:hypothetical protein|nr:MAG: hypothetical protein CVU56_29265 [Deltaproteobacteria bacterium HGW-Deltaproteobacteria-14]
MSILFSDGDAYQFVRSSGATGYGKGTLISDTDGTPYGPRHQYWGKDLAVGADTVVYSDTTNPSGRPISVGWERSFGSSVPAASTLEDWIRAYYQAEVDGGSLAGLNLHDTQIDPGSHSLKRNSSLIGQIDVYDYAYGGVVLSVEHWWLNSGVGSPVLHRAGNDLEVNRTGSAGGSALYPDPPASWGELVCVVVL